MLKMDKVEIRSVVKYLALKGMTPQEVHDDMRQTLGDGAPAYPTVVKWHREFRCGRESCEDATRSGRPSTSVTQENIDLVSSMVMQDRRMSVKAMAESAGISIGSAHSILTECLMLHKVSARWVPRMLTPDQKATRVAMCHANLQLLYEDRTNFWSRVVTMDETWIHHFDPETKKQSMVWKHRSSPPPKKFRVAPSAGKVMASVFWDSQGVIMVDYLATGGTVTGQYYATLIIQLRENIKAKRRGMLSKGVLLLQDNAPSHTSQVATAAIRDARLQLLQHPPYSPDLAPSDFYLFPRMKDHLRGTRFDSNCDVIAAVGAWLEDQDSEFFFNGITALQHRWEKCVAVAGDYVEK